MSVEREMSLAEWCAKLPSLHLVNQELSTLNTQLAALAEQNEKMRKALTKWRYLDSSYHWRCGPCGNEVEKGHKKGCALSLPDLATPVLNRIKAEAFKAFEKAQSTLLRFAGMVQNLESDEVLKGE